MKKFYVAVYECDRAYGGPQEGGWWYDYGIVQDCVQGVALQRSFNTHAVAKEYQDWLQDYLDSSVNWNADGSNRDLGSVCCAGRFLAYISEGPPADFPEYVEPWC